MVLMPREHGRILSRIWQDTDFQQRSPGAQRLYMQLLSQPTLNWAGVLPLQPRKWAKGCTALSVEDVWRELKELDESRYVVVDDESEEVLIRSYIRNDRVDKQPNVLKAALRQASGVESPRLRAVLAVELRRLGLRDADVVAAELSGSDGSGTPREPVSNPSGTLPEPVDNPGDKEPLGNPSARGRGRGKGKGEVVTSQRGQVEGHAQARNEPPQDTSTEERPRDRCAKHAALPRDQPAPPCGQCADARRERAAWDANAKDRAVRQAEAERFAVRACELCTTDGQRITPGTRATPMSPYVRCDHTPLTRQEPA